MMFLNKPPVYIGPTLGQRTSIFNKLLSKTKLAGIRWSNFGPTKCTQRNSVMLKQVAGVHWPNVGSL